MKEIKTESNVMDEDQKLFQNVKLLYLCMMSSFVRKQAKKQEHCGIQYTSTQMMLSQQAKNNQKHQDTSPWSSLSAHKVTCIMCKSKTTHFSGSCN